MSVVQQVIDAFTSEIRRAIRKQIHQGEVAFERYLRKMLVKVLKLLALSMMGVVLIASASVFLLVARYSTWSVSCPTIWRGTW